MNCPDCDHEYHSRRCFAVDGMKQCQCARREALPNLAAKMFPTVFGGNG